MNLYTEIEKLQIAHLERIKQQMQQLLHTESILREKLNRLGVNCIYDPVNRKHRGSFVEQWDLDEIGVSAHMFCRLPDSYQGSVVKDEVLWPIIERYREAVEAVEHMDVYVQPPRIKDGAHYAGPAIIVLGPAHLQDTIELLNARNRWYYRIYDWLMMLASKL